MARNKKGQPYCNGFTGPPSSMLRDSRALMAQAQRSTSDVNKAVPTT